MDLIFDHEITIKVKVFVSGCQKFSCDEYDFNIEKIDIIDGTMESHEIVLLDSYMEEINDAVIEQIEDLVSDMSVLKHEFEMNGER